MNLVILIDNFYISVVQIVYNTLRLLLGQIKRQIGQELAICHNSNAGCDYFAVNNFLLWNFLLAV